MNLLFRPCLSRTSLSGPGNSLDNVKDASNVLKAGSGCLSADFDPIRLPHADVSAIHRRPRRSCLRGFSTGPSPLSSLQQQKRPGLVPPRPQRQLLRLPLLLLLLLPVLLLHSAIRRSRSPASNPRTPFSTFVLCGDPSEDTSLQKAATLKENNTCADTGDADHLA